MLNVRVEIKGDKKVIEQLKRVMGSFSDWRPELQAVGDYVKDFYQNPTFETEGGIFGERWTPLQPGYAMKKAVKYPGRGILEASGAMRRSYEVHAYANILQLINPVEYAVYHQEGRGVPERILIKVDEPRKAQIVDIFKKGVLIKLEKAIKG